MAEQIERICIDAAQAGTPLVFSLASKEKK